MKKKKKNEQNKSRLVCVFVFSLFVCCFSCLFVLLVCFVWGVDCLFVYVCACGVVCSRRVAVAVARVRVFLLVPVVRVCVRVVLLCCLLRFACCCCLRVVVAFFVF